MPKNSRCRSAARKPLADVSNGGNPSRTCKKKPPENGGDGALDRLLLAHTDLSKLINQIDELVVQAFKHRITNKKGSQEIESFIHVLSDIHSSLELWVPRFEQAFGSLPMEPENQLGQSLADKNFSATNGERNLVPDGQNKPELGLIVSPSPLVSWRAGACTVESGRQLFLLTPLPKSKVVPSKCPGSSKFILGKFNAKDRSYNTLGLPPLSDAPRSTHDDLLEKMVVKPTPNKFSKSGIRGLESTLKSGFVSPLKISNGKSRDNFIYCLTPRPKSSPPRSCNLLDPISDSFRQNSKNIHKLTPWVARTQKNDDSSASDNSSSDEISNTLASMYPELFGLQQPTQKSTTQRKEEDETLDWFLSPPKTCVLMEPMDEKLLLVSVREKESHNQELTSLNLAVPLSTPMCNDMESTIRNGKKPGETTLKRELWTKFEAVSANGLQFDASVFQRTSRKRFLDMLEEVS